MIRELKIKNLALIEELHLVFEPYLTVFTGETGAGKSIVLQAIALLSGRRQSSSWVRTGAKQAVVEALFTLPDNPALRQKMLDMGLEADGELLIKRVLSVNGSSRFYLNGSLATARLVTQITENLLSVASQHDHQQLLAPSYHLDFVDLAGDLWEARESVAALYDQWSAADKELAALRQKEMDREQRRDFLSYQYKEISGAALELGEDEKLTEVRQRLKSSDNLQRLGRNCIGDLTSAEDSLARARKEITAMAELDPTVGQLAEGVAEQSYLAADFVAGLRDYMNQLPADQCQLEEIGARIDLLQQLKRKYGATLAEVIAYGQKAKDELEALDSLDERLTELEALCAGLRQKLQRQAEDLSKTRRRVAAELARAIKEELQALNFTKAEFEVVFQENKAGAMQRSGLDRPEFMFSANPGEPLKPLAKVASGGELSRLMLALRCILAQKDLIDTVIFDEVDAGIGGKAAEAVARKIKELSCHHQVMCITHLPQIAAGARVHFVVEKEEAGGRTRTSINLLAEEERAAELARMLAGAAVSGQTMAFAAELLARNSGPDSMTGEEKL
jgi:DNA repair protein RecN (Recombination protein N)